MRVGRLGDPQADPTCLQMDLAEDALIASAIWLAMAAVTVLAARRPR